VYFQRHAAAHHVMCIHKFSVVLCLLLSQEPIDYRHKTRLSCLFNLRQHHGKIDGIDHISRFTSGATNTPAFIFGSDNFGYSSWIYLNASPSVSTCLTNCLIRPNLMFKRGISIFAASTSGCCFML